MLSFQLVNTVSDIPGVSDFINDNLENILQVVGEKISYPEKPSPWFLVVKRRPVQHVTR